MNELETAVKMFIDLNDEIKRDKYRDARDQYVLHGAEENTWFHACAQRDFVLETMRALVYPKQAQA